MLIQRRQATLLAMMALLAGNRAASAATPTIRIGFLAELSGKFAAYGVPSQRGAMMALDAISRKIGDVPVELVVRDTQSDPQVAVAAMNEIASDPTIQYIVGPVASNIVTTIVPTWRQNKKLWMLAGASDTSLEAAAGAEPLFFHANPYAYDYHRTLAGMLRQAAGSGATVAVIYTDGAFGRNHIDFVRRFYPEAGLKIVQEALVPQNTMDMRPALMRIRQRKPDILLAVMETGDAVTLAKQVRIVNLGVPYLIGMSFPQYVEWQNATGPAQESWVGVASFLPSLVRAGDSQNPALFPPSQTWVADYRRRYNADPDQLAAETFAAMGMLLLALDLTPQHDMEGVAGNLRKMTVSTLMGPGHFSPSPGGTRQETFNIMTAFQRQNGVNVPIYPADVAKGHLQRAEWSA